jgi:tetratricopeptide (TPR) repeat protein
MKAMEAEGYPAEKPLAVLEIASGLGLFALNFIQTFTDLDASEGTDFTSRLKYYLTDFSEENVRNAAANPYFQEQAVRGTLCFCVLDALNPQTMTPIEEKKPVPVPELAAIIGNYVHCCLPTAVVRKTDDGMYEKHIRLSLKIPEGTKDPDSYAKKFVEHPVGERITENLKEETFWEKLPAEFFDDPLHEEVIRDGTADFPVATVLYPRGSFRNLQGSLPGLLPGGIILISDKGYADTGYMEGERACEPSIHGNSFAHSFNFPLAEILMTKLGQAVARTTDQNYSIQTMLIEKRKEGRFKDLFDRLFVRENENIISSDFFAAGQKFEESGDFAKAIRFYDRTLELRKYDAHVYYRFGICLTEAQEFARAAEILAEGLKFDFFGENDFEFRIGFARHKQGRYEEAIAHYERSLVRETSEIALYNIGLCYENSGDRTQATDFFMKTLAVDPNYKSAREALERICKK